VQERLSLWEAGWEVVRDYPWLGVGPGNFANIVGFYNPEIVNLPMHNSYLAIAAEIGIPGLILFSALVISVLIALIGTLQAGQTEKHHTARMILACILGFLAGAIFITRHDAPLLYLMLGWAIAITRSENRGRTRRSVPQIS
jgi:putative inorganic carbon (HCO3(-)) transporter